MIKTDIIIIGAGPVGLFTVFEAGLLKLKCHLIDSLPIPGGQCSEIYPKKPIYDIPGFPSVLAGDLIDNLEAQAAPFKPGYTLGERAETIEKEAYELYQKFLRKKARRKQDAFDELDRATDNTQSIKRAYDRINREIDVINLGGVVSGFNN